eukprot:g543.t1
MDATLDPKEIQETCSELMGNKPDAISLVQKYFAAQRKILENSSSLYQGGKSPSKKNSGMAKKQGFSNESSNKSTSRENGKQSWKTQSSKRSSKSDSSNNRKLPSEVMQRKVVNCLSCGKIFDSRKLSEAIYKFIDSGGICDFCGNQVNLDYGSKENLDNDTEEVQRAIEFKDRLVDFDRNAAQRTSVLDDQSDYFEIESNVWLDEKEKRELRLRKEIEDEFSKTQRNKVHYTIDLLGRRVFVSETNPPNEQVKELGIAAAQAAESTSAELPQGGGTGAKDASQVAEKMLAVESVYKFQIHTNPDIKIAPALFLPSAKAQEISKNRKQDAVPSWIQNSCGRLQHDDVFAAFDEDFEQEVVSTDLTAYSDLFNELDNGVFDLCPNTESQSNGQLITPVKTSAPVSANTRLSTMLVPNAENSVSISSGPELPHLSSSDEMPDGIVLLKDWLSFEDQIRIVETVRNLGIGEGGFYTPGYGTEAKLKLKMMCLGLNWNPDNRIYESSRSNFDGAKAPPVPEFIKELVQQCMNDATRLRGRPFSQIQPNVCLCNFYTKDSLLGLHQDREEGSESLKRQIPVVSFSIGATGEFVFNTTRSMDTAKSILLESGDALIFGGPSRMIFHGIRKIFPESMSQELVDLCGMRNGRLNLTIRQYIPET